MKRLVTAEWVCLVGHGLALVFGLAGLLIVLPNPQLIASLPTFGQTLFGWSMLGGGVVYIVLGAIAVALYAYRTLGLRAWLGFMVPAVGLSLSSELLGTSTGFPFGHYRYLSGLGYKVAGLVPFTIPLSWFYMGLVCYVVAIALLSRLQWANWVKAIGAIGLGAVFLTAWDFVLDPAMSQTPYPFWEFQEIGEFFGMPYRNLAGWMGTGALFMTVAGWMWRFRSFSLTRAQLTLPLAVYLLNFAFGAIITVTQLDARYLFPTAISVLLGVVPVVLAWVLAPTEAASDAALPTLDTDSLEATNLDGTAELPATVGAGSR